METLNYKVLSETGYNGYILKDAPVKVMQFGEGNFLRAFVDYFYDIANEKAGYNGKVKLVQPIGNFPQMADWINEQEGLYTLYLRGSEKGQKVDAKRVISCVSDCVCPYIDGKWDEVLALARSEDLETVVSNTTEAGIAYTQGDSAFDQVPPNSFPAKLTRVLYERYKAFNGAADKGLVILSCELIDNNGKELKKCCNNYAKDWNLEAEFIDWMNNANTFCSTLVDRIVPGRIRDPKELAAMEEANGYHDQVLDVGEVFGVWVIEGPAGLEDKLPFKKAGVNVMVVPDVTPYKKRKVRILNGAHTGFVLGAYLAGFDIVRDCMHNDTVRGFMNKMLHEEIIPTLPLDKKDLEEFASAVEDRFNNPFVNHELPKCLTMSLAAYIAFYSNDIQERTADGLICKRPAGNTYKIQDDAWALDFYYAHKDDTDAQLVHAVLTNTQMWDQDLTKIEGLEAAVLADLELIRTQGAEAAYKSCL
ncbi:MAG: altronate oxidoreductase [Faecalibacterium prausnitzii]|nr:MAG: altronate oxidoreductase [Faecalibacterium prausnitzii]